MNNLYYLSHGGPGSGRYPLGSGDRPYQKFEGSRKKMGGISGYIKSRKEKKAEDKKEEKRISQEKETKYFEENKEKILRSGTASEIMRYKERFSNKELSDVADRIRIENQLSSYSEKEIKTALNTLKNIQAYSNVGSALAKDGIELWNSFAAVYNVTKNGKIKPLPFITKGDGGKKK